MVSASERCGGHLTHLSQQRSQSSSQRLRCSILQSNLFLEVCIDPVIDKVRKHEDRNNNTMNYYIIAAAKMVAAPWHHVGNHRCDVSQSYIDMQSTDRHPKRQYREGYGGSTCRPRSCCSGCFVIFHHPILHSETHLAAKRKQALSVSEIRIFE
jgi:hypothetical protein